MTKISTFFSRSRELILVDAEVIGHSGRTTGARLVVDTGSAATTLTPSVVERIGYSRKDGYKDATVTTAIGEERGYWLHVAQLDVLGVATPNFAVTVFPLGHQNLDGLVGMNFLRHFNFEICPAMRLIHLEMIEPSTG
jgi:clan AA aspartic protease (TIGR02281 family)